MLEKMKKINPKIGQLEFGTGGRDDITGSEILLGAIGCRPHYVELLINIHQVSSPKKLTYTLTGLAKYLNIDLQKLEKFIKKNSYEVDKLIIAIRTLRSTGTISSTCEEFIYQDFYNEYKERLLVTDKKQLLYDDDVFRIVRCAIIAYEQNITKDVDIYNMLGVSQSSWTTKYSTVFHNCVYYIHKELSVVAEKINKRLEKT